MEKFTPEAVETKVPSKSLAVTSLVCGIVFLAGGGVMSFWFYLTSCTLDKPLDRRTAFDWAFAVMLADSSLMFVLPFLAIIFGCIPLKQGKGGDWDGKGMAKLGLVAGIVSLVWIIYWLGPVLWDIIYLGLIPGLFIMGLPMALTAVSPKGTRETPPKRKCLL